MAMSRRTQVEGAGAVLLLAGLALTHTLGMLWHLVRVAGSWAAGFVFDPLVWLGVVLGVAGIALILVGRRLPRSVGEPRPRAELPAKATPAAGPPPGGNTGDTGDTGDPEIAAILKKYGIS